MISIAKCNLFMLYIRQRLIDSCNENHIYIKSSRPRNRKREREKRDERPRQEPKREASRHVGRQDVSSGFYLS